MSWYKRAKWTAKYKRSIDCSNPKGFSQRAHCQGRKKRKKSSSNVLETAAYKTAAMRLKDVADIKINFPDADFWMQRKGSSKTVGRPTDEFSKENIGIKITATDVLDAKYLKYALEYLWMQGKFAEMSSGMLNLVHLRLSDVENIRL